MKVAIIGTGKMGTCSPSDGMPGMGAFAYFKDSEGNVMGLWETA